MGTREKESHPDCYVTPYTTPRHIVASASLALLSLRLQRGLAAIRAGRRIFLRIGVNLGDIIGEGSENGSKGAYYFSKCGISTSTRSAQLR